jgi:spore coat protein A
VVGPGEVVSFLGRFDGASGEFMYHCHILDHEDHTMMRPFVVLPADVLALHGEHGGGGHGGH